MLWPGAQQQQQPSGNGLRLLRELPVHFAIDYRGWTPTSHPRFSLCASPLISPCPQVKTTLHWTVGLHRSEHTAVMNFLRGRVRTVSNTQASPQTLSIKSDTNQHTGLLHCFQQGIVPCAPRLFRHAHKPTHKPSQHMHPIQPLAPKMQ